MTVFFTSDLHIGHALVAGHRAEAMGLGGTRIPEVDIAWHDRTLAENWDAVVRPTDQVWVLGDISSGSNQGQKNALKWIADRPGEKHLIAGNHDDAHPMHRASHNWQPKYMREEPSEAYPQGREVFRSVQMAAKRRVEHEPHAKGHSYVFLSHFPYRADRGPTIRHPEWRLKNTGTTLLHGHTHSDKILSYDVDVWHPKLKETPQIHVGPDAWGMQLVPWYKIKELILLTAGIPLKEKAEDEDLGSSSLAAAEGGDSPAA